MKTGQKVGLSILMGLSVVMVGVALIGISGFNIRGTKIQDLTWLTYWQIMEGCIACIIASIAALRSLFIVHGPNVPKKVEQGPSSSMRQRFLHQFRSSRSHRNRDSLSDEENQLPAIPPAALFKMKRFVRRNNPSVDMAPNLSATGLQADEQATSSMNNHQVYVSNEVEIDCRLVRVQS